MPAHLARPDGLIFDLDGTLVDTVQERIDGWVEALGAFGLPTTAEAVGPMIGIDGKRLAREVAQQHGRALSDAEVEAIDHAAGEAFDRRNQAPQPLPGLADVLAVHLAAAGYTPVVAHDGLEALYALERAVPAAVVLDLHLPRVSGFRLLQLLRQDQGAPPVPVLVLTALSFGEARDALRAGADAFLTKPFRPADVVAQAERLIAGARQRATGPQRAAPAPVTAGA